VIIVEICNKQAAAGTLGNPSALSNMVDTESKGSLIASPSFATRSITLQRSLTMISVRKSAVPSYLRESEFYRSLNCDEEDPIELDENNMKLNTSIVSFNDLEHYLSSIRFWGASRVSDELIEYCFASMTEVERAVVSFPELHVLKEIIQVTSFEEQCRIIKACELGNCDIVSYLYRHGHTLLPEAAEQAARYGHLDCLQYVCVNGCEVSPRVTTMCSQYGHFECLQYAHSVGGPWNGNATSAAAAIGRVDVLQYLHEHGCPWDASATKAAAICNQLNTLRYAHEHGCPWGAEVCENAAERGYLELLKYAYEHGCPLTVETAERAAENGHLECLRYAFHSGCPKDTIICVKAAARGHLDCLKYAHEHGCSLQYSYVADVSAASGHLHCLQYVLAHDSPLSQKVMQYACRGSVEVVRYLRECCEVEWNHNCMPIAACLGRDDILSYGLQNDAPAAGVCASLSHGSSLECLKIAYEHGCGWGEDFFTAALHNKQLEVVRFAHEHGCPWSAGNFRSAILGRSVECVRYVHEHGCPYVAAELLQDVHATDFEVFRYLVEVVKLPIKSTMLGLSPDKRKYMQQREATQGYRKQGVVEALGL
jgi:hypothetical protein